MLKESLDKIRTSPVNQTSKRPISETLLLTTGMSDTNLATISGVIFGTFSQITKSKI